MRNSRFLLFALLSLSVIVVHGQKELKTKSRVAKKEAKQYERDKWYVAPGSLPLEKQLEQAYMKQLDEDEDGFPKFIIAAGNATAGTQSAAKLQATELAKLEIANSLSSQIAATIDNQVANNQINQREAVTLQKTVAAAKTIIATKMDRLLTLVEMYREVKKTKNMECQVTLAYSQELARQMMLESMKESLEEEADIASEKLEQLMKF